jgi:hypothetical protein
MTMREHPSEEEPITFHPVGVETLLGLPRKVQRQALRKARLTIAAAPAAAGYPLRRPLHGFRGIHTSRFRIIWRVLLHRHTDFEVAEICYIGKRTEGDEDDAYVEFARLFGLPDY